MDITYYKDRKFYILHSQLDSNKDNQNSEQRLGCCHDSGSLFLSVLLGVAMIIGDGFMAHGKLHGHLCKTGSALHKVIITYPDVKTTTILLDEKWVAKVSDFGL